MSVSQALATLSTRPWSRRSWPHAMGFIWSRDAACAETTRCARRSTTSWPPGPATPWSCAPSRRDNAELDKCDRVTIDSVRNHCARHFPVQNFAKATYREILERRAKANGVDFVEGVATALTPIAFFETVMVKSYETLVDSNTKVDVNTGIVAAGRLQSLIDSRDYSREIAELKVQVGKIGEAVKSTVPQEMWGEIVEKLEELEQHPEALDVGMDSFDDADDDRLRPDRVHRRGRRVLTPIAARLSR